MRVLIFCTLLIGLSFALKAQSNSTDLLSLVQSYCKTSAVTGREDEARVFIQSLFEQGTFKQDKLGNLILTLGSGSPRRLLAAPLDEPGYVVSAINPDGYLRIATVGYGHYGNMFHQFMQGNEVIIGTDKGSVPAVAIVPSSHFEGMRAVPELSKEVYQWQETFVDVGESSAKAVGDKGIRLLDPVTANKKVQLIADQFVAAPSAKSKAAAMALATAANTLMHAKFKGTVVIAFTALELINGRGIEDVVQQNGPFDQIVRFNRFLDSEMKTTPELLVDKTIPTIKLAQKIEKPVVSIRQSSEWETKNVYGVGIPSRYTHTPTEMVQAADIQNLIQCWLRTVDERDWKVMALKAKTNEATGSTFQTFHKENQMVADLVARYGVSRQEQPVREYILSQMPAWARPTTDAKGNIVLTFGKGKQHIAFVAHMDEVGFVVDTIRNDGTLVLGTRGGFVSSVWEGHAAIAHAKGGDVSGVYEPRKDYLTATMRRNGRLPLTVYAGFSSRQEAINAGVVEGETTVTMPKKMIRLSEAKATARGFDDRVGCASLLMALQQVKPESLPFKVTFVWAVEEEVGLVGSTFAAKSLQDLAIVYPIDTFVSSDDPIDPQIFANCPLGNGAVIRVIESINIVRKDHLNYLQSLAETKNVKVQYGMTAGGTDGQGFLKYDIPSVPLSWPGRYSHSPVEVMDFRDMDNLVKLIGAIMMDTNKVYN